MAPKAKPSAKGKPKAKAKATAKAQAKARGSALKAAAKATAKATAKALKEEETQEADAEAQATGPEAHALLLRKFPRQCADPLKQDLVVNALAAAIKALPRDAGKGATFKKLITAFNDGGFAECKKRFAHTELLRKVTSLSCAEVAVPRTIAIGKWFAGQPRLFAEALAQGEIQEVQSEQGHLLYMYVEYTKTDKTEKKREVQSQGSKGLDALQLDFNFAATGNLASAEDRRSQLALTDAAAESAAAEAAPAASAAAVPAPLPAEVAKTWAKLEEALAAALKLRMRAQRLLKHSWTSANTAEWSTVLQSQLTRVQGTVAGLEELNVDRSPASLPCAHAKMRVCIDQLTSLSSTCTVIDRLQSGKK